MSSSSTGKKPMTARKPATSRYHHGALRAALLEAGEAELAEKGVEGFSLRGVAKRAGVSHAAPAHHFGDANGLLTALAAVGFRRFLGCMQTRQHTSKGTHAIDRFVASGLGYVDFAMRAPALFRLMFSSARPDFDEPTLKVASDRAFLHLVDDVRHARGVDPWNDGDAMLDVMAGWSLAHGLADLLLSGRLKLIQGLEPDERERAVADILRRVLGAS